MSNKIKKLIESTMDENILEFETVFEQIMAERISAILSEAFGDDEDDGAEFVCPECGGEAGECDCDLDYEGSLGSDGDDG